MEAKKARVIKNVVQALVVVALGYIVRHQVAQTHALAWVAAGWLLTAWVVLRLALATRRGYATFRDHTKTGVNIENIDKLTTATMQPWARGYYEIEKKVYRGTWRTIARVAPGEPANVFIALKGVTQLEITAFGSPRQISKRFIVLYVDQPAAFVAALTMSNIGSLHAAIA